MTTPIGRSPGVVPAAPLATGPLPARVDREVAALQAAAEKTYAGLIRQGARIVVSRSDGNNGKPIITVIPPALASNRDPSVRYDVQVHYHGMHGTVTKPNPNSPVRKQIEESFKRSPPTVFVLPETDNVAMTGGNGPVWRNSVRNTGVTATDGVAGIVGTRGRLTVSAHSLGRDALISAIRHGGLEADRVDVQDGFSNNRSEQMRAFYDWATRPESAHVAVRISTGMASKEAIRRQAPFPDSVFSKSFARDHWGAELQPWP